MFERKNSKPEPEAPQPQVAVSKPPTPEVSAPKTSTSQHGKKAMIGSKVKVTGDIESSEDLLIEGQVNGTVKLADNELVIGTSGRVEANVEAKNIRIEGQVKGDIVGQERVVITASGNVEGNVTAPRVMLEDGGRFKGSIDMGTSKVAPAGAAKPADISAAKAPDVGAAQKASVPGAVR